MVRETDFGLKNEGSPILSGANGEHWGTPHDKLQRWTHSFLRKAQAEVHSMIYLDESFPALA